MSKLWFSMAWKVPKFSWFVNTWNKRCEIGETDEILGMGKMTEIKRAYRYRAIAKNLKKIANGNTHLDIGTGPGRGLKEFLRLGFESIGIEPDVARATTGLKEGYPVINSTLEAFILKNPNK